MERIDCSRAEPYWRDARPFPRGVAHPLRYTCGQIDRALRRVESLDWAKRYRDRLVRSMDRRGVLTRSDDALRGQISDQVNFPLPRCPVDRRQRSWRSGFWDWSPKDPAHVRCRICGSVLPGPEHEPTGEMVVVGPSGKEVTYRYWEDEEGYRYFFENMLINYRHQRVMGLVDSLATAFVLTGETGYARKAAVILARIAEVYPHYPVHGLGQSYINADLRGHHENRFYRDPPFPFVSARLGNFHASPFSDAGQAFRFAVAYDLISTSGALESLSAELGRDVRIDIERDLLYEAARYTMEIADRATNYDGSRIRGMGFLGRVLDEPEFVSWSWSLYRRLIDNCFWYDNYWNEDTLNYFAMIVGGVLEVPELLSGASGIDVNKEMPFLPQIYAAPMGLFYPDGRTHMANDTWAPITLPSARSNHIRSMGRFVERADEILGQARIPVADVEFALFSRSTDAERMATKRDLQKLVPENTLVPGAGNAILGVGRSRDAVRASMCFGPWAGHHHRDSLSAGLFALGKELLSDIGYTHTLYRPWATSVASHNTVVVDGREQTDAGGRLLCYQPASRSQVGCIVAEAPGAFAETSRYRRSILLVPTGGRTGYVVDLFEVEGGDTHDYLLHGAADFDQALWTDAELADAAGEMGRGGDPLRGARYDYLKNTRAGDVEGKIKIGLEGEGTQVDVWFPGVRSGRLLVSDGPSIRRAQEDDGRLDEFWYPVVCLRIRAGNSRFLSVTEAHAGQGQIQNVELLAEEGTGVVLEVDEGTRRRIIGIDPSGEGFETTLPDGRRFELYGRVGVLTETGVRGACQLVDGSRLRVGEALLQQVRGFEGSLMGVEGDITGEPERSELVVDARLPVDGTLDGKPIYATHPSGKQTAYLIDRVSREGEGSRIVLAGMPRFVRGRAHVASGVPSRFTSTVEHPKTADYPGSRVRVGERCFTIREMDGRQTFATEEAFDFSDSVGEAFEVFSTAAGDRFRIAL